MFECVNVYTSEDLKWDARKGVISKRYWNPTLYDLKCHILNHKSNTHIDEKIKISNYINEICNDQENMNNEIKSSGIHNVK
jgi:hypothetical protein